MNILLVDDHTLFRDGFKLMVESLWDTAPRIVEAGSAEAGLSAAGQENFDLIFLDLGLPGLEGMDSLRLFRRTCPATCLVVLSAVKSAEVVRQALLHGAQGYIPKTVSAGAMREAIGKILEGDIYVPTDTAPMPSGDHIEALLTERQVDVLGELCAGRSNREIAEYLGMSENTVRVHVSALFRQLDVRSRTEAVLLAKRKGWF